MKISVVTVCLNAGSHIQQTLSSVASQTWRDVEHIIIDGGSTDCTLRIIQEAAEINRNLRWNSDTDHGISDAMNKGLAMATGDVVAFLHADDFYPDNSVLEKVVELFSAQPEVEWLTGGMCHVDGNGRVMKSLPVRRWSYRRLLRGNTLFHPATFVRRRIFQEIGGFDTRLNYVMDYDLWLRLGKKSAPYLLNQPLASFRVHPESLSFQMVDAAFLEEFKVRWRYLQGKPLQKVLHLFYFGIKFLPNRLSVKYAHGR